MRLGGDTRTEKFHSVINDLVRSMDCVAYRGRRSTFTTGRAVVLVPRKRASGLAAPAQQVRPFPALRQHLYVIMVSDAIAIGADNARANCPH